MLPILKVGAVLSISTVLDVAPESVSLDSDRDDPGEMLNTRVPSPVQLDTVNVGVLVFALEIIGSSQSAVPV